MLRFKQSILATLAIVLMLSAWHILPVQAQDTLYERMGGQAAIEVVVTETVNNWLTDERISQFFTVLPPERLERLNKLIVEQICDVSGGPCVYSGRTMKEAHMGMGLTDADFDAVVEGIVKAMNTFHVSEAEQNEMLPVLASLREDVVEAESMPETMPVTGGSYNNLWIAAILMVVFGTIGIAGWNQRRLEGR